LTGSTAPTSATEIGGVDSTGKLQNVGITLTGAAATTTQQGLVVSLSPNSPLPAGTNALGSVTVTGTVAVTQSTSPWVTSDLADGSATGGTAGTKSALAGLIYNSSAPTLTTGQQVGLQGDSSGNLLVNLKTALPAGSNVIGAVTQSGTWTVAVSGTVAVTQSTSPWVTSDLADGSVAGGTAGTKSMLAGLVYNTTAPTLTNGQQASLQGDASGNLLVNLKTPLPAGTNTIGAVNQGTSPWVVSGTVTATNPSVGATGAAVPADATYVGGVSTAGNLTAPGVTLASTAAVATQTALVVALSPNTPLPAGTNALGSVTVTGTVAVTQSTSPWVTSDLADGSASGGTAGTKSMLAGLIYNSSAPTLTTGQQASLQGDASGNLLVNLKTALPAGSNVIGAVTQSGTWTVQQGTPPWTVTGTGTAGTPATGVITIQGITGGTVVSTSDAADGSVTGGTAGTKSMLGGTIYNTLGTAPALTTGQQASLQSDIAGNLKVTVVPGTVTTYRASIKGLTVAATPTDVFTIIGSATKTITITRISFSGSQSSQGMVQVRLVKYSSADTGGTSSTLTAVPLDSANATATAVVKAYTANPTLGTAVGDIDDAQVYVGIGTGGNQSNLQQWTFGNRANAQGLILRGVAQQLSVNLNGTTLAGNNLSISVEWTEQ